MNIPGSRSIICADLREIFNRNERQECAEDAKEILLPFTYDLFLATDLNIPGFKHQNTSLHPGLEPTLLIVHSEDDFLPTGMATHCRGQ